MQRQRHESVYRCPPRRRLLLSLRCRFVSVTRDASAIIDMMLRLRASHVYVMRAICYCRAMLLMP